MTRKIKDPEVNSDDFEGLYGHHLNEGPFIPIWKTSGSETIKQGNNNSFVILGRDRDGHAGEGVGGQAGTGCGSIDIVAGLGGQDYKEHVKKTMKRLSITNSKDFPHSKRRVDPSFFRDAARIYITEKGDIDSYMGLAVGSERVQMSKFKSAVGIKADHVRLVGREHIKIVTGKMRLEGAGTSGEKNSSGGAVDYAGKIDLIAGNYTDSEEGGTLSLFGDALGTSKKIRKLQPIPKGDNLKELLENIIEGISTITNMVNKNTNWIQGIITNYQTHIHEFGGVLGSPTGPPVISGMMILPTWIKCWGNWLDGLILTFNMIINRIMYLSPLFQSYINSRFVNTT